MVAADNPTDRKILIILNEQQAKALERLAEQECRTSHMQAKYQVIQALMGYGFLPPNDLEVEGSQECLDG